MSFGAGATTPCALSEYAASFGSTGVSLQFVAIISIQLHMSAVAIAHQDPVDTSHSLAISLQ